MGLALQTGIPLDIDLAISNAHLLAGKVGDDFLLIEMSLSNDFHQSLLFPITLHANKLLEVELGFERVTV